MSDNEPEAPHPARGHEWREVEKIKRSKGWGNNTMIENRKKGDGLKIEVELKMQLKVSKRKKMDKTMEAKATCVEEEDAQEEGIQQ